MERSAARARQLVFGLLRRSFTRSYPRDRGGSAAPRIVGSSANLAAGGRTGRGILSRGFAMKIARVVAVLIGVLFLAGVSLTYAQAPKAPDVVVLKGAPNGDVTFSHAVHAKAAENNCVTCHHASKPEKPAKAAQEACRSCHTKAAAAPMKTKMQAAFHNPLAKAGTCVDCHLKLAATNKKVPAKCTDCHKKA